MLTPDLLLLTEDAERPLRDIHEKSTIWSAAGWGELVKTRVEDIFVQFDHKGPVFTLTTSKGAVLRCSPDHPCFARFNPVIRLHTLYLMERSSLGFRIGLSHDLMKDLFAMEQLKTDLFNQQTEVVDRLWIIETTENLPRAAFLEKLAVFKYGLPDVPFSARHIDSELTDAHITEIFNQIDTPSRAHQLLLDWHMYLEHPHITVRLSQSNPPSSNAVQFIIFGGSEKGRQDKGFVHLIRIDGAANLEKAEHNQFKRRMSSQGQWNLEVTREDLSEAQLFVKTLSCLDNLEVVKKIQLTKKAPFYILPASHVKVGMQVPVLGQQGIEEDYVISVSAEDYQGPLYDYKVDGLYNYIAGQWVVMSYGGNTGTPPGGVLPGGGPPPGTPPTPGEKNHGS